MNGFGVLINGVMTTQSDTVKYNKEFNEWVNDLNNMKKKSVNTSMKDYNSDITKMAIFVDDNKTNYVVVDTLAKMDSWEITNEIETFMGYKCQKAIVNYKQEKYTALFTTQLPYNAGPDVFRGLPGLILKVSNTNSTLGYEAIEILTPYKGLVPMFNNDGLSVSRKEWVVIINKINKKAREARANMLKQYKKNAEAQNQ
jgi:GLPGLI family protein